jgi:hypothetical protein
MHVSQDAGKAGHARLYRLPAMRHAA